jgi:predicted MFS family arabinose efflux permease
VAETRAREPILPLILFRNRTFAVASAVSLMVNLALFGSTTYLPIYLQVVKSQSPSASGLELLPMMLGMITTSVVSGRIISARGRLKLFPIAGTAIMTIGLLMLSRLSAERPVWQTSVDALVLGLGLGMVIQVLVLAAQNSVGWENLGVATAGTTLFRSLGGALGVAIFGAIFANALDTHSVVAATTPSELGGLLPDLRTAYIPGVTAALRPVFVVAAIVTGLACGLLSFLREND